MPVHSINPVYDKNSKILILGSFPSVKSREQGFFYGHPQNRFWCVTSSVFGEKNPETIEEKKAFLIRNRIALWDVIASCNISGSSDSSITQAVPNDIEKLLQKTEIDNIFLNGKTSQKYYNYFIRDRIRRDAICLPSTSPANAAWTYERLFVEWKKIKLL